MAEDGQSQLRVAHDPGESMSNSAEPDYDGESIPLSKRRSSVTMGLLWITMVTSFPSVLIGFQWYKDGLTLGQVLGCTMLGCLVVLVYSIPAAYLGAKSGQTYGMLSRQVFGRLGSHFVSFNLLWIFIACYALWSVFLADGLTGLLHLHIPMAAFAAGLAILMACNNFFGFTGVTNFAKYAAAPILIGMTLYTFFKVVPGCPTSTLFAAPTVPPLTAITAVTGFVTGFAVWGNEADYWRYGKPHRFVAALPLTLSLCVGQVIFPSTGWMVARMSGITEFAAATAYINDYAFGGIPILAGIVLPRCLLRCKRFEHVRDDQCRRKRKALPPQHSVRRACTCLCRRICMAHQSRYDPGA